MKQMQVRMLQQNDVINYRKECISGKPKVNHFVYTSHNQVKLQVFEEREWIPNPCFTISNPPKQIGLITSIPKLREKFINGLNQVKFRKRYSKKYNEPITTIELIKVFINEIVNPYITIHVMFKEAQQ